MSIADKFAELERDGFTVIENVVPAELCAAVLAELKAYMRSCGVDVDSPALDLDTYPNMRGIMQQGVGHLPGVWAVRLNENVQRVFEALYGTNDLLVSFDGACWMPAHLTETGRARLHVDQAHTKKGRWCVQGYVNLLSSHDAASGSLSVSRGSHRLHTDFVPREGAPADDWYSFTDAEFKPFAAPERVHGGVGSLVLWDSRTAHRATAPLKGTADTRERAVVYVSMQPTDFCTDANLKKKAAAFQNGRMTSHWAASKIKLFPATASTFRKKFANGGMLAPTIVTNPSARMLELAGVKRMSAANKRIGKPALEFVNPRTLPKSKAK